MNSEDKWWETMARGKVWTRRKRRKVLTCEWVCRRKLGQVRDRKKKEIKSVRLTSKTKHMSFFLISAVLLVEEEGVEKKDCAISLPTGFIFVHCRLVSQCNAPPITSHSVAPSPNPSRPPAHTPNTLWRQPLLRWLNGGRADSISPTECFLSPLPTFRPLTS